MAAVNGVGGREGLGAVVFNADEYMSVTEAARELGVHPDSVRSELKRRRLPVLVIGLRKAIPRRAFEQLEEEFAPRRRAPAS